VTEPFIRTGLGLYILDENGNPQPESDTLAWGRWSQSHSRQIAMDFEGNVRVSTVFLGVDHRMFGGGLPILWETMIFGGRHDQYQERYTTRAEAEAGHARALAMVKDTP
jgi:hypothetical protein